MQPGPVTASLAGHSFKGLFLGSFVLMATPLQGTSLAFGLGDADPQGGVSGSAVLGRPLYEGHMSDMALATLSGHLPLSLSLSQDGRCLEGGGSAVPVSLVPRAG